MRDGYPKCRNRTYVRLVMPAAWAEQSLLNDTPKCRSRAAARLVMLAAWAKQSPLNWTPKYRSPVQNARTQKNYGSR